MIAINSKREKHFETKLFSVDAHLDFRLPVVQLGKSSEGTGKRFSNYSNRMGLNAPPQHGGHLLAVILELVHF